MLVVRERRRLPFDGRLTDWLALAFGALVVVYGLLPQSWLGGGATHRGVLYAARHDLLPVAAYFLGRGLQLTDRERARLCHTVLATAAFVAAFGLIDVYAVPLSFWRPAAGWFRDQLGLVYSAGTSGLPENFVYNAGNGVVFRRLTSTFLSPLATSYLLVVALFFIPMRRRWGPPLGLLIFAALLWTHTRSALLALVARARPARGRAPARNGRWSGRLWSRWSGWHSCRATTISGRARTSPRPSCRCRSRSRTVTRRRRTTRRAPTSRRPASISRRCATAGARCCTIPWGFGLGNSGVTAARTHVTVKAGESTYTELGVETGILGMLVFVAWSLALLRSTLRKRVWVGAAFAAVLLLGLQTDVIGVPWIAVTVWAFAGDSA